MEFAPSDLDFSSRNVISIVLGGGAGTRLFPLTKDRAKPAVPLAGKYRLVDIPISNCIHSKLQRIFVLTQFQSSSLHRHIQASYRFDNFSNNFVEIMAAEQTQHDERWYQGTADAVRQNILHFESHPHDLVLILCGDQLYRANYQKLIYQHAKTGADVTVGTVPVKAEACHAFGIMEIDNEKRITRFVEKPKDPEILRTLKVEEPIRGTLKTDHEDDVFLASMGVYVFNRDCLTEALKNTELTDFGKHIIPEMISTHRVYSYIFQDYWEDIGTIRAFYEANLDLTADLPKFNFFDAEAPIYSRARYLPASKVHQSDVDRAIIADGCVILRSKLERCVVGIRSRIGEGTQIKDTILMGMDFYETASDRQTAASRGEPPMGIGNDCRIESAIIDKNVRIGNNVRISPSGKPKEMDGKDFYIRDGIVCVPKKAVLKDNTVI
ncbi:MAG: glucose-1-phosphate adenylyltransferase [Verrucomicrobiota bacterium]